MLRHNKLKKPLRSEYNNRLVIFFRYDGTVFFLHQPKTNFLSYRQDVTCITSHG